MVLSVLYILTALCVQTPTQLYTHPYTQREKRWVQRKEKRKPLNSFYNYIMIQNQMAIMEENKVQDDNTNEFTGKYPQQNTSKMD